LTRTETGLAHTTRALAFTAARRLRHTDAARLNPRQRVTALAAVRLRDFVQTRLTRTEAGLAQTTRPLALTAARRLRDTDAARLKPRQRIAALTAVRLRHFIQPRLTGTKTRLT
jgi:hypothetical protein